MRLFLGSFRLRFTFLNFYESRKKVKGGWQPWLGGWTLVMHVIKTGHSSHAPARTPQGNKPIQERGDADAPLRPNSEINATDGQGHSGEFSNIFGTTSPKVFLELNIHLKIVALCFFIVFHENS